MSTFKHFSDLPRELRDQIWSLAIREDRPGVHIFRGYDRRKDKVMKTHAMVSCDSYSRTLAEPSWHQCFPNIDEDCSDKNVSTYLQDGGMWTACKESRLVMESYYRQSEWQDIHMDASKPYARRKDIQETFKMPSTGYFAGGPLHCFTVFPHRDLFVLQTDDLESVDWASVGDEPLFFWTLPDFEGIKHIAIEYNPEWGIQMSKDISCFCYMDIVEIIIEAAFEVETSICKIWFIDHSLRRRADAPTFEEKSGNWIETNAFYASDRRLLELDIGYGTSPNYHWQYLRPVGDISDEDCASSHYFVQSLAEEIRDNMYDHCNGVVRRACEIGLLGWDDL
ncbi:hypothetical protein NW762_007636 [Fusarium torreyae]|uniref:2EXR domain-containing protein n=1 Tax=Fusarium torreyae TaxID=1237075 RepID=A0A9W8RYX6_9HYPO|nr:hypothetical protein NW762_007636 [Fusarium torreyae]